MPELPEVETVANGVNARVRGRRITQVWTSGKPQTFKSPEIEIAAALGGAKIESVRRVGKTIVMTVAREDKCTEFLIHLGMTGRLLVCTPEMPVAPHTHAVLDLDDGREVRFVDPRRFGRLSIHSPEAEEEGHETSSVKAAERQWAAEMGIPEREKNPLPSRSMILPRSFAIARRRSKPRC